MQAGSRLVVFVAPVRTVEYVAATCLVGVLRVGVTLVVLAVVAALAYGSELFGMPIAVGVRDAIFMVGPVTNQVGAEA